MINYEKKARYLGIDFIKACCAFLVVCIHCPFHGMVGEYIVMLARIAVPIFFMITGFFYVDVARYGRTKMQIRKIFFMFIKANLLYLLWYIFLILISGDDINSSLKQITTLKVAIKFLIFNDSPFSGHLWYLGAILYVLIICELTNKKFLWDILYIITPILLLGDLSFGKYSMLLFGREFPYILVRNFLFVGLPYFCIGKLIRKREESKIDDKVKKNKYKLLILIIIALIANILEKKFFVDFSSTTRDHYLSTTFLAIYVFLLVIQPIEIENKFMSWIASIGRQYSTWIYIMHPIFIIILRMFSIMNRGKIYNFFEPIIVYFVTLFMGVVWNKIILKWKGMQNERN